MGTIQALFLFLAYFSCYSQNHVFAARSSYECGVRRMTHRTVRVVGGSSSTFGKWPWQAHIINTYFNNDDVMIKISECGGALVTRKFVITAAHCCDLYPKIDYNRKLIEVVLGDYDVSGEVESKRSVKRFVKRIVQHPEFDVQSSFNDIGVLELSSPVNFDTHIVPICMPTGQDDFAGRMAWLAGWGLTKYNGTQPKILKEVKIPIIENQVCQDMLYSLTIPSSFLCAGYTNITDSACMGDSGGPLMLENSKGRWMMVGLPSATFKCGESYLPTLYMRVTSFIPWLKTIIGDLQF